MGLREKALLLKKLFSFNNIDNLEVNLEGKTLSRQELLELKNDFNRKLETITTQLDHKLIDMQTLFEIGNELNSTLKISDLIQILIFTLMGQFQLSDIAVFMIKQNNFELMDKKGKLELKSFQATDDFVQWINRLNQAISIHGIHPYPEILKLFEASNLTLLTPIKSKEGAIGILLLGNKITKEHFHTEDLNFIYTLSSLAGIAFENAALYEKLDKKYNELSTLYEVSRVINSSDDYHAVLNLITETISTGFGVKKAVLFIEEFGHFMIRKTIGISDKINGQEIPSEVEFETCFDTNKAGIITLKNKVSAEINENKNALFIPFVSIGKRIGGIIVFELQNYEINKSNEDLINLFSIIASQIAPSALLSWMIAERNETIRNPYLSVIHLMESEISKAKDFGVNVQFLMLKLTNFHKFCELHGSQSANNLLDTFISESSSILPASAIPVRLSSNNILLIVPAIAESDLDELKIGIYAKIKEIFNNTSQIILEAEIFVSEYPESGEDPIALLNLIE